MEKNIKKVYLQDGPLDKKVDNFLSEEEEEDIIEEEESIQDEEDLDEIISDEEELEGGQKKRKAYKTKKDDDAASIADSQCTVDLLSNDPLFLVLSHFFVSKESGDNIATILEKLNKTLEKSIRS